MNEDMRFAKSDGAQLPVSLVNEGAAQIDLDAQRLLLALEAIVVSEAPAAAAAEKYTARLNFALERVEELRMQAETLGGVFAPARAEVALSILEGHVAVAAGFINRTMRSVKRSPGRRELHAAVDEAVTLVEEQQNKAA
jgi:hypothetical protein